MSNINYYVNIDSRFKNNEKYQNPCDFGVGLVAPELTGPSVNGLPVDSTSYFELGSIDPDFDNDDLQFINCKLTNYKRDTDGTRYYCGLTNADSFFVSMDILYKGVSIFDIVPPNFLEGIFCFVLESDFTFRWGVMLYPSYPWENSNTSKNVLLQLSETGKVFLIFDFSMPFASMLLFDSNFIIYNFDSIAFVNPNFYDGDYCISTSQQDILNRCAAIAAFNKSDGSPASYQGRGWGYHTFGSNFQLDATRTNGKLNFVNDKAENLFVSSNVNPFNPIKDIVPLNSAGDIPNSKPSPHSIYRYTGTLNVNSPFIVSSSNSYDYFTRFVGPGGSSGINRNPTYYFMNNNSVGHLQTFHTHTLSLASNTYLYDDIFHQINNRLYVVVQFISSVGTPIGFNVYDITGNTLSGPVVSSPHSFVGPLSIDSYTTTSGNILIAVRDGGNNLRLYECNTSTFTVSFLTSAIVPSSFSGVNMKFLLSGGLYYLFLLDYDSTTDIKQRTWTYSYNRGTNTLSYLSGSYFDAYTSNQAIHLFQTSTNNYLVIGNEQNPEVQIIDITDPVNQVEFTPIIYQPGTIPYSITKVLDGVTHHYITVSTFENSAVQFYNVDDLQLYSPQIIGDSYDDVGCVNYVDNDGYLYGRYQPENMEQVNIVRDSLGNPEFTSLAVYLNYRSFRKTPTFLQPTVVHSSQTNQNLKGNLVTEGVNPHRFVNLYINNKAYSLVVADDSIQIFDISNIKTLASLSITTGIDQTFTKDVQYLNVYGNHYIILARLNTVELWRLDENLIPQYITLLNVEDYLDGFSGPPTDSANYTPEGVPAGEIYYVQKLIPLDGGEFLVFTLNNLGFKFRVFIEDTLECLTYATWLQQSGELFFRTAVSYYYSDLSATYIYVFSAMHYAITVGDQGLYIWDTSLEFIGGAIYSSYPSGDSCIIVTDLQNKPYLITYDNIEPGIVIYDVSNPYSPSNMVFKSTLYSKDLNDYNSIVGFTNLVVDNQTYILTNLRTDATATNDFLQCVNVTDPDNPSIEMYNSVPLPGGTIQMDIVNYNRKYYSFTLSDNGSIYMYDVTNIKFAQNFFDVVTVGDTKQFNGVGSAFITKISNDGLPSWFSYLTTDFSEQLFCGQNINISNAAIDTSQLNLYLSGGFKQKIKLFNAASLDSMYTGTNNIKFLDSTYSGYLTKIDTITGQWKWITPMNGPGDDYIEHLQYNPSKDSVAFVGYTNSNVLIVYNTNISNPSTANTPLIPTVPQAVITNPNLLVGFVISINNGGVYGWNSIVYSDEDNRFIRLHDLYIDDTSIHVLGYSNSNTTKCTSTSQVLYSIKGDTQYQILYYKFNTSGGYLGNQYIVFPDYAQLTIQDIKAYASDNTITILPTIQHYANDLYYIYNKDGTLGKEDILNYGYTNPVIQYKFNTVLTDSLGQPYSKLVYHNAPNYAFTGSEYKNYNIFILGDDSDTYLNKSFTIRDNYIQDGKYILELFSNIDLSKSVRKFQSINGITGSTQYYPFSLSPGVLNGMVQIAEYPPSQIGLINVYSTNFDVSQDYYLSNTGGQVVSITGGYLSSGVYMYYADTSLLDFSNPFYYLLTSNPSVSYTLQFYPSSQNVNVTYLVTLNRLIIPNRPVRLDNFTYDLNYFPYLYVYLFSEDEAGIRLDKNLINIVYDNNINRSFALFQIPMISSSAVLNYMTLTASTSARISFKKEMRTIRMVVSDHLGRILNFDRSPYKTNDKSYTKGDYDDLINITANLTFTKQ